jgi:phytanoyl-CoA dioxygenase PhyH
MTTVTTDSWNTDLWAKNERMCESPNWHGVSPEVIARRGKPWNQDPDDVPWLDRDDADERIQRRLTDGLITAEEAEMLHQWVKDGYFILRRAIEPEDFATIDEFNRDLDDIWTADRPIDGLQIMSLHIRGRRPGPIDHAELLEWPLDVRIEMRDTQLWRVHYWHCHSKAAMKLSTARSLLRMSTIILEEPATLVSYIGFKWGSEVGVHQDLAAMHIHPKNRLVGVWLGGEDVDPLAGPLSVYPGSHQVPIWPGWNNYPQTNLRTCHLDTRAQEEAYLKEHIKGSERVSLPVNKGDAIMTHGLLIHSGEKIRNRSHTRFSSVIHYTVPGGDKTQEIVGPYNW